MLRAASCPLWFIVLMAVAENIAEIRERMARAARRAGRSPDEIRLMAVSKTFPAEKIREAYGAGLRLFGENRVQEFAEKVGVLGDVRDRHFGEIRWHMIGHLQTNKAAKAAELFDGVDSVDSVKLAEKLNSAAEKLGKKLEVLIGINIGGEAAKSGAAPDSRELEELLLSAPRWEALSFRGLMTVPPYSDDPESARRFFRRLRELRDEIAGRKLASVGTDMLSMGMSHDFEIGIEEGSTCVRVGTAIFGTRGNI